MTADIANTESGDADVALRDLGYEPTLRRQLGLGQIVVYGLLFLVPMAPVAVFGVVQKLSGGSAVVSYLVAAAVMSLGAVSYRELSLRFPVAGTVYGYLRGAIGPRWGFLAGWLMLLDYLLMPALLAVLGAAALSHLLPSIPALVWILAFTAIGLLINLRGIAMTTRVGLALVAWQFVVLLGFGGFAAAAIADGRVTPTLGSLWGNGITVSGVLAGAAIAALGYLGFDAVNTLNEEAVDGGRTVGRATVQLLVGITAIFLTQVVIAGLIAGTGLPEGTTADKAFYAAVAQVAPGWFVAVFTLSSACVAIFSCLLVAQAATARLVFAMARDGLAPAALAGTSARGVPVAALLGVAVISILVAGLGIGHAGTLTALVTFGALSATVLLHIGVIRRCWLTERTGAWLRHLVVPVFGALTLTALLLNGSSLARWVGGAWLILGIVLIVSAKQRILQSTKEHDGSQRHH